MDNSEPIQLGQKQISAIFFYRFLEILEANDTRSLDDKIDREVVAKALSEAFSYDAEHTWGNAGNCRTNQTLTMS